mmetsp:Transcript_1091/g.1320  ORF Transcript_1091/g.1320 Transcript_1091/m.1320 type:complete len:368 (+) Transcript_1091:245-1348(+)
MPSARVIYDENGEALTPSMVAFLENGKTEVGWSALNLLDSQATDARYVIRDAKRFIGRAFDDASVAPQAEEYSYQVIPNGTCAAFQIDPTRGHGASVTPERVGELVVRRLLQSAQRDLGHTGITTAVIAVPAGFGPNQTRATADAFKAAGLKIARILPEPVAAAVAYGLQRRPDVKHVLVYDFGGGTLDVSVLYVRDGSVEVVANHGDNDLGGSDFDHCIAHALATDLNKTEPITTDAQKQIPPCAPHVLLRYAEDAKIALTDTERVVTPPCRRLTDDKPVSTTILRSYFESQLCGHLFQRAISVVHSTLKESMIRLDDIDEVVLVGGTSRIPKVRSDIKAALNIKRLNTDIDPDVTVAVGAASVLD